MNLRGLLENPVLYELKSRLLSLGRRSVQDYLSSAADLRPDSRILDVGCGAGGHAEVFSGDFWGVDRNLRCIAYARRRRRGRFLVMDATRLAFPSDSFDFVYCVGLCHHLSDQQVRAAASEMKRVTKKGGRTLIIDGVFPPKLNLLGYALFKCDRGRHTRTLGQLEALLAQEGFRLILRNISRSFPYRRAVFSYQK